VTAVVIYFNTYLRLPPSLGHKKIK